MLTLQMLPAGNGDCLWLEYGPPGATRIVIIDGGVRDTVGVLQHRIDAACRERGTASLDVELLVVTHIDNDHILGILELLEARPAICVKDLWFNGRRQLIDLPRPQPGDITNTTAKKTRRSSRPADLMGGADDDEDDDGDAMPPPWDLLGPQEGDALSELIAKQRLPWNTHPSWKGGAIVVPDSGHLPFATLDGDLRLTLLGPTLARLYKLRVAWPDVLGGIDEPAAADTAAPADLLGRRDTWPPVWNDDEQRDSSKANGSSIMLLAEYDDQALLLAADGHAPDLVAALDRLCRERHVASMRLPLAAFKLPHHGSQKNLNRAVIEKTDCSRYLISTDGSGHRHPDHQSVLCLLRYSSQPPELLFNYDADTTRPWRDSKADVLEAGFPDYQTAFPENPEDGLILTASARVR
jgi:hypothetical protein